jgi:hypothetical protein
MPACVRLFSEMGAAGMRALQGKHSQQLRTNNAPHISLHGSQPAYLPTAEPRTCCQIQVVMVGKATGAVLYNRSGYRKIA